MSYSLSLTHEIFVPRELLFQALTEPSHLSAWYSPSGRAAREISMDFRPGGEYLFVWAGEDDARFVQRGVFHAVDPPSGFRCSQWLEGAFAEHFPTELAVTLVEGDGCTWIEVRQEGFPSTATRDAQRGLWDSLLDQLEAYFSVI